MTGLTVRPLGPDDRPQWQPLWRAYLAFYETSLPAEVYESTWGRLLTAEIDPHGFCAVDDEGLMLGIVHYLFHTTSWAIAPNCYLQDLYVAESARGRGSGRALIEAVYAVADARGVADVYWTTQHFNHTARRLYDTMGVPTAFMKYKR